ncbi:serine hydroxymethyltransferase [Candidatus Roizmanbacteria bacterium]|nr:MAG: serine hydroxymethyltransferase [Candidatus Roizmanbacteria bacterium]
MAHQDKQIYELIEKENYRQKTGIELIPSENYASEHVRKPLSSSFVNKYSEGYPKKRYYGGNENVDEVELIAQERAKKLFGVEYANVQPYSGSPANFAVYMATCQPGDTIMGQALVTGGHLTHGAHVSFSATYFNSVQYGVLQEKREKDGLFDFAAIRKLALEHKPKLIWVGASAYPLQIPFERFAEIADEVGAYLAADIAHIAGLVAGGQHPSPVPHVHIVTTTTHKTLRGPRGGIIMVTKKGLEKDPELPQKINKAVFPGLQGGPHDNQTAAIAVALYEASQPDFKKYAAQIVKNAQALAKTLKSGGINLVGEGSENHLILADLTKTHGAGAGYFAEYALDAVGLTMNKNTVPGEQSSPFYPSGIRMGTPAATTRGMKEKDMQFIGNIMLQVLEITKKYRLPDTKEKRLPYLKTFREEINAHSKLKKLKKEVEQMAVGFDIP